MQHRDIWEDIFQMQKRWEGDVRVILVCGHTGMLYIQEANKLAVKRRLAGVALLLQRILSATHPHLWTSCPRLGCHIGWNMDTYTGFG